MVGREKCPRVSCSLDNDYQGEPPHPQDNGNRRNAVLIESSFVRSEDLREQLNAPREWESQRTGEEELLAENKALAKKMAKLERQIGSRLKNFEQVVGNVAKVVNVDAKMYTSHEHPFTKNIIQVPLPEKYKPPPISLYDGRNDPNDHIEVYIGHVTTPHGPSQ